MEPMMNNPDLDQDLVRVFTELRLPADRIACFLPLRELFLDKLSKTTKQHLSDDALIWRLVQLRKQQKLPSLHRDSN